MAATWGVGQLARDRTWPTALAFYLPSVLVAIVLLALAAWAWRHRRSAAAVLALAALAPAAVTLGVESHWRRAPQPRLEPDRHVRRIVHMNVHRGRRWPPLRDRLVGEGPDLLVLTEPPYESPRLLASRLGPDFASLRVGDFSVVGRGGLEVRSLPAAGFEMHALTWTPDGATWTILLVDLPSSLLRPRHPALKRVVGVVARMKPDLVLGDVNAPRRSWALSRLPRGWTHGYDEAGAGWSATWPVPLPLWAIDLCLVGPRVRALDYRLRSTPWSDHRFQRLDAALAPS